jgi:hypothetical protein
MNHKIIELATQAGLTCNYDNLESLEQFARLIAQECIEGFDTRITTRYEGSPKDSNVGYGMEIVVESIKSKFGIGEDID